MYRGLLQGAFAGGSNDVVASSWSAAWFALIHFRPVEYPGLFVFGLVLGAVRSSPAASASASSPTCAFNATGLLLACR